MPADTGLAKTHFLENCDLPTLLEPAPAHAVQAASKIVCTLGPACRDVETLVQLMNAGMTAARVDLTWGPVEYHEQSLKNLGVAMQRTKRLCAIIVDTIGREIMILRPFSLDENLWPRLEGSYQITAGQEVRLTVKADAPISMDPVPRFPVNYPRFTSMAEVGDTIFIGRYLVSGADESSLYVEVKSVSGDDIVCEAKNSAVLAGLLTLVHSRGPAGATAPVDMPLLADADRAAFKYLAERFDIDFIALTFTQDGADVRAAREALAEAGLYETKILAKVEDGAALTEFDGIADEADGIIFSRGNIGLDVAPEKMARVQKAVISACNVVGKPVLVTRLCDTMTSAPRPTRAEATDVANAVLDGADGFLLGAETLRGKFPLLTVQTIVNIAAQAERVFDHRYHFDLLMEQSLYAGDMGASPAESTADLSSLDGMGMGRRGSGSMARNASTRSLATAPGSSLSKLESIASTAVRAADKVGAGLIVVYANRGTTTRLVAKYRPPMPVVALVVPTLVQRDHKWTLRGLAAARQTLIVRGVVPMLAAPMPGASDAVLSEAVEAAVARGLVEPNQHVVCLMAAKDDLVLKILNVDSKGDGVSHLVPGSSANLAGMNPTKSSASLANGAPPNGPVSSHPLTPPTSGMVAH